MYYYDVALGAEKHWDSARFTYGYDGVLPVNQLVQIPFGPKQKIGVVVAKTTKPTFKLKELIPLGIDIAPETMAFLDWYQAYYHAPAGLALAQLFPSYLPKKPPKVTPRTASASTPLQHTLSDTQRTAIGEIHTTKKPTVLHGITGSGKTYVYLTLVLEQIKKGASTLILYPEISLTPQLLSQIEPYAPVIAIHSAMTNSERAKAWYAIATATEPIVVIGPRSSLFMPHHDLGLIIVDEAHDSSYKQETGVRYNGLLVAGGLAHAHNAKLILGSATPPVTETEYITRSGGNVVCMHEQAIDHAYNKEIYCVDNTKRELFAKHPLLSTQLIDAIARNIKNQQQSLLFLNRRGTAKVMLCEQCGWQAECADCELPLTYHHDDHILICHTCGFRTSPPSTCPKCSQPTTLKSFGSKAIVTELTALFPGSNIARFDSDNKKGESLQDVYDAVRNGDVDILVGTQQIAKGLDLPKLKTVGVINADLSLHFPDFSADERTFQLISQVSGRVSRGHQDGEVFIQTAHPNSRVIQYASKEDWHAFYRDEIETRTSHSLPPFAHIARLIFRDTDITKALKRAESHKKKLEAIAELTIQGPIPAFHSKRGGYYYIELHLSAQSRKPLLRAVMATGKEILVDLDPVTLL